MDEIALLHADNPERVPDWRWRKALLLSDSQPRKRKFQDEWIGKAKRFAVELHGGASPTTLSERYPDLYFLHQVFVNSELTRSYMEALIAANESPEDIAERMGWKDPEKVRLYERIFFDVRDRLRFDIFVLSHVVGINPYGDVPTESHIWKLLGWVGYKKEIGTVLLDAYTNPSQMQEDAKEWFDKFIPSQLTRKTAKALLRYDAVHNEGLQNLVKLHNDTERLEIEKRLKGIGGSGNETDSAYEDLISTLSVTTVDVKKKIDSPLVTRTNDEVAAIIQKQMSDKAQQKVSDK